MGQIKNIKLHIVTDIKTHTIIMGQIQSSPRIPKDDLNTLLAATHFKKDELKKSYKKFMKSFPGRQMNEEQFFDLYGELFPADAVLAHNIFKSFDHDGNGSISFKELMVTLSLTTKGTKDEKLRWLFSVYDCDQDGRITVEEVSHLAHVMVKASNLNEDEDHVSRIFNSIDADRSGFWTLEEFVEGISCHPELVRILQVDAKKAVF